MGPQNLDQSKESKNTMKMDDENKFQFGPILFLHYEVSLVSSNLNSNLHRFHCAHPNVHPFFQSCKHPLYEVATFKSVCFLVTHSVVCHLEIYHHG